MKKITARINKSTGKIEIKTEGYDGAACLAATKPLEEGLGLRDLERELTPEYYQENQQQEIGGT